MRWMIFLAAVALMAAPAAIPPGPWATWLNEDVIYIISSQERAAFGHLRTDQERQQFMEEFWKRRNPRPETSKNEFKQEHYRRIAYVNDHFQSKIPGWKTDRGKIYIMLGPPDKIESSISAVGSTHLSENWLYRQVNRVGANVVIQFVWSEQDNEYRINSQSEEIVARAMRVPPEICESTSAFNWHCSAAPSAVPH